MLITGRQNFDWRDTCRVCVNHLLHPSFLVNKLWGYFVGEAPAASTRRALERACTSGGFEVRPLDKAILRHLSFYDGPRMVIRYATAPRVLNPDATHYPTSEGAAKAVSRALAYWGDPEISAPTRRSLLAFSRRAQHGITADWERVTYRILRQNALRALIPTTPDWQTC